MEKKCRNLWKSDCWRPYMLACSSNYLDPLRLQGKNVKDNFKGYLEGLAMYITVCFIHISSCGSITDDSRVPQSQLCANAPQSIHNYLALPYLPLIFHSIPLIYPTTSPWMPPSMSINVAKPNHQRLISKNACICMYYSPSIHHNYRL